MTTKKPRKKSEKQTLKQVLAQYLSKLGQKRDNHIRIQKEIEREIAQVKLTISRIK